MEENLTLKREATLNIWSLALRASASYYKSEHGENKTIIHFLDKIFNDLVVFYEKKVYLILIYNFVFTLKSQY